MRARLAAAAVSMIGRIRCFVATTIRVPYRPSFLLELFNLHNQDRRVADQNADQRQHAWDRNESEGAPLGSKVITVTLKRSYPDQFPPQRRTRL